MNRGPRKRSRAVFRPTLCGLGFALAMAGCSGSFTGPVNGNERDSLEFSFVRVDSGSGIFGPPRVSARGSTGAIHVDGFIVAPCDTWLIRAGLTRDGESYRLRLFYRVASEFCEHPVLHRYHATIVGVGPGRHGVRVRQPIYDPERRSFVVLTVLETAVDVTQSSAGGGYIAALRWRSLRRSFG